MSGALQLVARLSVPTFIVSSMLAMGLGLKPRHVLAPLRSPRLVIAALFVNFVFSPGIAYLLVRIFPLERPYAVGLLLLSLAAGAPFLPKLAEACRADLSLTAACLVLLTAGTILFMPFAVPLLIPGAAASPWAVAKPLVLYMAVPLAIAMATRPHVGRFADPSRMVLGLVANVSLLVVLVLFVGLNLGPLWGVVGSGAGLLSALFAALVFAAGYVLGGSKPEVKGAMALAAAARNVAAALPAASNQSDPKVIVMLLVGTLAGLVVLLPAGAFLRRRAPTPPQEASSPPAATPPEQATAGGDEIQSARR